VVSSSNVKQGIAYLKITPLHCLKMSGTDNPVTQQHIPGEQRPQSHTYSLSKLHYTTLFNIISSHNCILRSTYFYHY